MNKINVEKVIDYTKVLKDNEILQDMDKILRNENTNLKLEIKRLKEEYVILQNASDEVEEEKDKEIERLNNIIKALENLIKEDIITNLCEIENKRIGYGQTEVDKIWLKKLWGFKKYIISKCDEISKRK